MNIALAQWVFVRKLIFSVCIFGGIVYEGAGRAIWEIYTIHLSVLRMFSLAEIKARLKEKISAHFKYD